MKPAQHISSAQNSRVKHVVRLRKRSYRDETGQLLVEGYRELARALDAGWRPESLWFCPQLFLGENETPLIDTAGKGGCLAYECTESVFRKISYRERPEGLLAVGPQWRRTLADISLDETPLLIVAEAIEKPGNLGTILRSADAAGVDGVIVCDRCTDINNPNVVRASIGTLFALPVVEVSTGDALAWLKEHRIQIVAATPSAETVYTDADLTGPIAVAVGTEQLGLSPTWIEQADVNVRVPMRGLADSLNVATATTVFLFEALRQREPPKG